MSKKQLWLQLKNYNFTHLVEPNLLHRVTERFGGPDAFTSAFAAKLARKLGWKQRFAMLAINEYKKFVFLGIVADFPVTPSAIIDKVWHEHLLFTKAYREFCTEVIKHPFDHNPELVPFDEQTETFQDQYFSTLSLYKSEFGIDPPKAIWGITKFDPNKKLNPTRKTINEQSTIYSDGLPLVALFANEMSEQNGGSFSEFNGGDFGGAGAGSSWDGSSSGADSSGTSSGCSSCSSGGGD